MGKCVTLLRKDEVLRIIGIDAATLWRWRKAGAFPAPMRLSSQTLRWREPDVAAWLEGRRESEGVEQ